MKDREFILPGARFSKVSKSFRTRKAAEKSQTFWLQSCFLHIFLIRTEVLFIQDVSGVYTPLSLNTDWLRIPGLSRSEPLASKGIQESYSFYLSYDKPCGKLALGQNCIKIISDKSISDLWLCFCEYGQMYDWINEKRVNTLNQIISRHFDFTSTKGLKITPSDGKRKQKEKKERERERVRERERKEQEKEDREWRGKKKMTFLLIFISSSLEYPAIHMYGTTKPYQAVILGKIAVSL